MQRFAITLVGMSTLVAATALAQPLKVKRPVGEVLPPKAAPPPLPVPKKLELVNKLSLKLGPATGLKALPPTAMRVSPIAPANNGATITYASSINFVGPSKTFPEGAFVLYGDDTVKADVKIEFPATKGKRYLVDCTLQAVWGGAQSLDFDHSGSAKTPTPYDDGHYFYVFIASATTEKVTLAASSGIVFHSCEISKLD